MSGHGVMSRTPAQKARTTKAAAFSMGESVMTAHQLIERLRLPEVVEPLLEVERRRCGSVEAGSASVGHVVINDGVGDEEGACRGEH